MPWFYVDDAFADSKPVMRIDPTIRNEAIGLWLRCGAWSAKEETDGLVPRNVVRNFNGTPRLMKALVHDAGLWVPGNSDENLTEFPPESVRNSTEFLFKKWGKWQKTRSELQEKRREAAERQRRSRLNRNPKGRNAVASGDTSESRVTNGATYSVTDEPPPTPSEDEYHASVTRDPHARARRPDPTRPLVVTKEGEGDVSSDPGQPPPRHCPKHDPDGTDEPCGPCRSYRLLYEKWLRQADLATTQAAQERARAEVAERAAKRDAAEQRRAQEIADCERCNDDGYRGAVICDHRDHATADTRAAAMAAVRSALGNGAT